MRRGVDLPASRSGLSTTSEQPVKPASRGQRAGDGISAREPRNTLGQRRPLLRRLSGQVEILPPSVRADPAKTCESPKSPAYLRGKNPYGRILNSIGHPYREQTLSAPGPPSQIGSSPRGRPRTSGNIKFVTLPVPQSSTERSPSVIPSTLPLPFVSPSVSLSVKDAKNFFESKASESRKHHSHLPMSRNAPSKINAMQLSSRHDSSLPRGTEAICSTHQSRTRRDGIGSSQCVSGPSEVFNTPGTVMPVPHLKADDATLLVKTSTAADIDNDGSNSHTIAARRIANRDYRSTALSRRRRRQASRSAPMENEHDANESVQRSRGRSNMSTPQGTESIKTSVHEFGEPPSRDPHLEEITSKGFSYDGSISHHDPVHHPPAHAANSSVNMGVEEGYDSIEVPDHIDCRSGYGRRRSEGFGFPGARIKPGFTRKSSKVPLQDPSNWIKRSCGHFSTISSIERREEASNKPCSQCRNIESRLLHSRHQRTRRRAATDTSTATSHDDRDGRRSRQKRRQHHSEWVPVNRCRDTFAQDLGYVIDSILEEHQNTLQHVINNIKYSQPNLAQLRRVSEDLIHRCRSSACDVPARHQAYQCFAACRHICQSCQPVCQPMQPCQPEQACNQPSCCPYVPPKAAEKLNVGLPGQLGLNLNDSHASLPDELRTGPDLVDLLKSAADDLGVDLDQRPSSEDNAKFEEAPVEGSQSSVLLARPTEDHGVDLVDDYPGASRDKWLERTRRQLSELSETRNQLMGELDTIAEDLGVRLEDYDRDSIDSDPVKRVLSKASTILSKSMIEQDINKQQLLQRVLSRISSQSRRMSIISAGLIEVEPISLEEIQEWLDCAESALPAAIDSIATLDTIDPEVDAREAGEQPVHERIVGTGEFPASYIDEAPRRRSSAYTDLIHQLQERVTDLKDKLRKESLHSPPNAQAASSKDVASPKGVQSPGLRAKSQASSEECDEKTYVNHPASRRTTHPPVSRKSTLPIAEIREPCISRAATSRRASHSSRRPTGILDPPVPQQKMAEEVEPDCFSRISSTVTRSLTTAPLSRAQSMKRSTSVSPIISEGDNPSEHETPLQPIMRKTIVLGSEEQLIPLSISRVSTRQATIPLSRQSTAPKPPSIVDNLAYPLTHKRTGEPKPRELDRAPTFSYEEPNKDLNGGVPTRRELDRAPTFPYEDPNTDREAEQEGEFQPPIMRKVRGSDWEKVPEALSRMPSRKTSTHTPRELDRHPTFSYVHPISRRITRQTTLPISELSSARSSGSNISAPGTRRSSVNPIKSPSPIREEPVQETSVSPVPTSEPSIVRRVVTRRGSEPLPSPDAMIRKALTLKEPPAPPSSPSSPSESAPPLTDDPAPEVEQCETPEQDDAKTDWQPSLLRRATTDNTHTSTRRSTRANDDSEPTLRQLTRRRTTPLPEFTTVNDVHLRPVQRDIQRETTSRPEGSSFERNTTRRPTVPSRKPIGAAQVDPQPTLAPASESQEDDSSGSVPSPIIGDTSFDKMVKFQEEPTADYSPAPSNSSSRSTRRSSIIVADLQPEPPAAETELASDDAAAVPVSRVTEERPVVPVEEIPEQEPGRLDRPPTADLSRDPESLGPIANPTIDRRQSQIPRVMTVLEKQRRPSAADPRSGPLDQADVPAGKQHPPAPNYPLRDTPSWTKPDKSTPPPKPDQKRPRKAKRGLFGFGSKSKPEPEHVQRKPSPNTRRQPRPFRSAAPGQTPRPPGGTLQRPRGYQSAPRNETIFLARRLPPPVSVYAPVRRNIYSQPPQAPPRGYYPEPVPMYAPIQRDVYTPFQQNPYAQPQQDYYPPPVSFYGPPPRDVHIPAPGDICPPPPQASARRTAATPSRNRAPPSSYRQSPSRQDHPHRDQANSRPVRGQAPEPLGRQSPSKQDSRNQKKTTPGSEATLPPRRAPRDQEPSRSMAVEEESSKSRGSHPDDQRNPQQQVSPLPRPDRRSRSRPRASQRGNPRGHSISRGQDQRRQAMHAPLPSVAHPSKQGSDQRRNHSMGQQGSCEPSTEQGSQENSDYSDHNQRDGNSGPARTHSMDGADADLFRDRSPHRDDYRHDLRARTSLPRASTLSIIDPARNIFKAVQVFEPPPHERPISAHYAARRISAAAQEDRRPHPSDDDSRERGSVSGGGSSRTSTPAEGMPRTRSGCESLQRASTFFEHPISLGELRNRSVPIALDTRPVYREPRTAQTSLRRSSTPYGLTQVFTGSTFASDQPTAASRDVSSALSAIISPMQVPPSNPRRHQSLSDMASSRTRTPGEQRSSSGARQDSDQSSRPGLSATQTQSGTIAAAAMPKAYLSRPARNTTALVAAVDIPYIPRPTESEGERTAAVILADPEPKGVSPVRQQRAWKLRRKGEERKGCGVASQGEVALGPGLGTGFVLGFKKLFMQIV